MYRNVGKWYKIIERKIEKRDKRSIQNFVYMLYYVQSCSYKLGLKQVIIWTVCCMTTSIIKCTNWQNVLRIAKTNMHATHGLSLNDYDQYNISNANR
jgi:hypothetical protein